jgi:periplasmic divalent cation tolerance protein
MLYAHIIVFITVPSREVGQQIADTLLESRLAACVNIVPQITSIYHWQGAIHQDDEFLLIAKTKASLFDALATAVKNHHPYDVPEVIAMPIISGSKEYLTWIATETR